MKKIASMLMALSMSLGSMAFAENQAPDNLFGQWLDNDGFVTPGPKIENWIDSDKDRIDDRLQAGAGKPAGKPRPEVEQPERPDPRVEEYRKVEKWLEGHKAEAAKAERDLEVKIAEANKNPDKREVEIHVKDLVARHDAAMAGHAGERKNLEDRLAELKKIPEVAELKEPFEVVLNISDYHLDPALAQWADSLPKTPYGLIVKGVWCHTLWDPVGLQVSEIELMTPTGK